MNLPLTHYWEQPDNPVEQIFWGRAPVVRASSFLFFEKGSRYQKIVYNLKYNNRPDVGILLGKYFGQKLKSTEYDTVDMIVPVPLHVKKEKYRGYNQSEMIALGIAEALHKPVVKNVVKRVLNTNTQTRKGRYERWLNVENIFRTVKPESLVNKHILVVDDVITTGSTTESFINELLKNEGVKVSVAALASA